jgi:hypothetical protein
MIWQELQTRYIASLAELMDFQALLIVQVDVLSLRDGKRGCAVKPFDVSYNFARRCRSQLQFCIEGLLAEEQVSVS